MVDQTNKLNSSEHQHHTRKITPQMSLSVNDTFSTFRLESFILWDLALWSMINLLKKALTCSVSQENCPSDSNFQKLCVLHPVFHSFRTRVSSLCLTGSLLTHHRRGGTGLLSLLPADTVRLCWSSQTWTDPRSDLNLLSSYDKKPLNHAILNYTKACEKHSDWLVKYGFIIIF